MKWVELGLSTHVVYLIGREILEGMETIFGDSVNHSKEKLRNAFAFLWKHSIQFVLHPILLQQNLQAEALKFYNDVAAELKWSTSTKQNRLFEVNMEILATGEYTHTQEELEIGARLAWRNSAKCIGR